MLTETGYIETLNEAEAVKHGKYEVVTEEVSDEETNG
jgi:hypothetical protein